MWTSSVPGEVTSLVSFSTNMESSELLAHGVLDQASTKTEGVLWRDAGPSLKTAPSIVSVAKETAPWTSQPNGMNLVKPLSTHSLQRWWGA